MPFVAYDHTAGSEARDTPEPTEGACDTVSPLGGP
jgi:hypothetical protein